MPVTEKKKKKDQDFQDILKLGPTTTVIPCGVGPGLSLPKQ